MLPFSRFSGADSVLGPEMKSTGEVMGVAKDFPTAFGKAQAAAGVELPTEGTVFITVTDVDKPAATQLATLLHGIGFRIVATGGTAQAISRMGIPVETINKIQDGSPHVVDYVERGEVDLVINTPTGSGARSDGYEIRSAATRKGIPCITTMTGASAAARAISAQRDGSTEVISLQELHAGGVAAGGDGSPGLSGATAPTAARSRRSAGGRPRSSPTRRAAATGSSRRSMPTGPIRRRGSSTCSARETGWGGGGGRPFLPRAFSVAAAERGDGGVRLDFLLEDVGPGTARLAALTPGERLLLTGPLGRPFSTPREINPDAAGRDPGRRRHRPRAAGDPAPRARRPRRSRCARCSASATRPTPAASSCFAARRSGLASEDGHAGPPRLRDRPARRDARGRSGRDAASSTPAGRRRCSRPCG